MPEPDAPDPGGAAAGDATAEAASAGATMAALTTASFDAQVAGSPLPCLVDFWAPWCAPCVTYEPVVGEVAAAYAGRLRSARVDISAEPELAERCGVRTVPTVILFHHGAPVKRIFGARTKRYLIQEVDALLS